MAYRVLKALPGRPELRDPKDQKVPKDPKDPPEQRGLPELRALRVLKGCKAHQDWMDRTVRTARRDPPAQQGLPEQPEQPVRLVHTGQGFFRSCRPGLRPSGGISPAPGTARLRAGSVSL